MRLHIPVSAQPTDMEKEHASKCETIEKSIDMFFREWAGTEPRLFLPDPMMAQIILKLSEAEDKIREAQVFLSQPWYDGIPANYIEKLSDFANKAQFQDGKLINGD